MKVSYVLPVWIVDEDSVEMTVKAILSLRSSCPEAELIVIDNASLVGGGRLRSLADVYIRNSENLGFCPAVNQGLKLAKGDYIAVCNNDIVVSVNWLDEALPLLESDKVGSVHFRMVPYDDPFINGDIAVTSGKERWCTTSFFVITSQLLQTVGYLDESFGKGIYDDYDYWLRVRKAGYTQAYTNKASYKHKMTHTYKKLGGEAYQALVKKNLEYFKSKWGGEPDALFGEEFPDQIGQDYWRGFDHA